MTHQESWHARRLPRVGNPVCHECDPRHVGELVAIYASVIGIVRWPNGWRSEFGVGELLRLPGRLEDY